jgi:hypothetical protein
MPDAAVKTVVLLKYLADVEPEFTATATCKGYEGLAVPMPTLPLASIVILSVPRELELDPV